MLTPTRKKQYQAAPEAFDIVMGIEQSPLSSSVAGDKFPEECEPSALKPSAPAKNSRVLLFVVLLLSVLIAAIVVASVSFRGNDEKDKKDENSPNVFYTFNAETSVDSVQFANSFDFIVTDDPKGGFADFQSLESASSLGLFAVDGNQIRIGADYVEVVDPETARGRKSVRVSSKTAFQPNTLFLVDIAHMPSSSGSLGEGCGLWPSFWTIGPDWPTAGEMIVVEYTNDDTLNRNTLHTGPTCDQGESGLKEGIDFSGYWADGRNGAAADNCDPFYCEDQWCLQGCSVIARDSYVGAEFNRRDEGGIFAIEWIEDVHVRMFHFRRDEIPADIQAGSPDPSSWGTPTSYFRLDQETCASGGFYDQRITFDVSFCGTWAGDASQQHVDCECPDGETDCFEGGASFDTQCAGIADNATCIDYVASNPENFEEAYWLINEIVTYDISTEPEETGTVVGDEGCPAGNFIGSRFAAVSSHMEHQIAEGCTLYVDDHHYTGNKRTGLDWHVNDGCTIGWIELKASNDYFEQTFQPGVSSASSDVTNGKNINYISFCYALN